MPSLKLREGARGAFLVTLNLFRSSTFNPGHHEHRLYLLLFDQSAKAENYARLHQSVKMGVCLGELHAFYERMLRSGDSVGSRSGIPNATVVRAHEEQT